MSAKIQKAYAPGTPGLDVFPIPVLAQRAPNSSDLQYPLLMQWLNQVTGIAYTYKGGGVWVIQQTSGGTGSFTTLVVTGQSTLAATNIVGATNINTSGAGITTIGTGGTGATNIGNATGNTAITGSATASTGFTATTVGFTATAGNLNLNGAASKIVINAATPASASVGVTAAMTTGAVTITSSAITTSSIIQYSRKVTGGTTGDVAISAQGTGSAVLTSTSGAETSTFNYLIIN